MAPAWLDRYLFYTRGRIPQGHEEWARDRLVLWRWIAIILLLDAVALAIVFVLVLTLTGGFTVPTGLVAVWVLFALVAPISAVYYRNKAGRALGVRD